jgi:uncharacterized protein YcaQ
VLDRLRDEGPHPTRAFEDRSAVGWRTGGWNDDGRNASMMLKVLWARGEVMIGGRAGQERVWDLASRSASDAPRPRAGEEARSLLDGYFVMPILHGDRIVGRIDPSYDRIANVLRVQAVFAEPDAPASAWPAIRRQIDELVTWLGADDVEVPALPRVWR